MNKKYTWVGVSSGVKPIEIAQEIYMLFGIRQADYQTMVKEQQITIRCGEYEHNKLKDILQKLCFGVRITDLEN